MYIYIYVYPKSFTNFSFLQKLMMKLHMCIIHKLSEKADSCKIMERFQGALCLENFDLIVISLMVRNQL